MISRCASASCPTPMTTSVTGRRCALGSARRSAASTSSWSVAISPRSRCSTTSKLRWRRCGRLATPTIRQPIPGRLDDGPIVIDADGTPIGVTFSVPDPRAGTDWAQFFGRPVEVVVFGGTHEPVIEDDGGVLLVNPGSPSLAAELTVGELVVGDGAPPRPHHRRARLGTCRPTHTKTGQPVGVRARVTLAIAALLLAGCSQSHTRSRRRLLQPARKARG